MGQKVNRCLNVIRCFEQYISHAGAYITFWKAMCQRKALVNDWGCHHDINTLTSYRESLVHWKYLFFNNVFAMKNYAYLWGFLLWNMRKNLVIQHECFSPFYHLVSVSVCGIPRMNEFVQKLDHNKIVTILSRLFLHAQEPEPKVLFTSYLFILKNCSLYDRWLLRLVVYSAAFLSL